MDKKRTERLLAAWPLFHICAFPSEISAPKGVVVFLTVLTSQNQHGQPTL